MAHTCNFTPPSLLSDYKDHLEHAHVACLLRMTEVAVTSFTPLSCVFVCELIAATIMTMMNVFTLLWPALDGEKHLWMVIHDTFIDFLLVVLSLF